ncbi:protocadherin beta-14-like [Physella acuta]|uniref:protocadherin beta-14-like n=1 Tax=Physella acuta TaxID=109671 RepID=UPI0027DCEC70|nr:protocadherin beta-14-like [Physella acuta]
MALWLSFNIFENLFLNVLLCLCLLLVRPSNGQDKIYNFLEEEPEGTFIGNIARDLNLAALIPPEVFKTLQYSIMLWEDGSLFRVDKDNSDLFAKLRLDREALCRFENQCHLDLRVVARSRNDIRKYTIVVNLLDINDNAPTFNQSKIVLKISESVTLGAKFAIPSATDEDRGEKNSIQSYSIEPPSSIFSIEYFKKLDGTCDVNLVVNRLLDRETESSYTLVVVARDGGSPPLNASLVVVIQVEDENDNAPHFPQKLYRVQVGEKTAPGAVILPLTASDDDIGVNAAITYRLSAHQDAKIREMFAVGTRSGVLTANAALTSGSYTIIVEAVDGGAPVKINQTEVLVTVIDTENDPPVIAIDTLNGDSSSALVYEGSSQDAMVAYVSVADPDSNENGAVSCYSQSSFFDLRVIEGHDYMVVAVKPLDREQTPEFKVTIFCEDSGTPRLNATKTFDVVVGDVNDNSPVFDNDNKDIAIAEDNAVNDVAMLITATDKDAGDNAKITFSLLDDSDGFFRIPPGSNALLCARVLDRETKDTHVVKILARDGGTPSNSATATVTITVTDVNDVTPQFFQLKYTFFIEEGLPAGSFVGAVAAFDLDLNEGGQVKFSLPVPGNDKFQILPNGTIRTLAPLDRELQDMYSFNVVASDNGRPSLSSQAEVHVLVRDVNDNAPVFVFPSATNNSVTLTLPVDNSRSLVRLQATDADEAKNGEVTYILQPGNASQLFQLNPMTGDLYAAKTFGKAEVGDYNLTITASDKGDNPLNVTRSLLMHVQISPEMGRVHGFDTNAMIAAGLVCGTVLVAVVIVLVVCVMRRRDKGKRLRYLDNKGEHLSPQSLNAVTLANQYSNQKESNNNSGTSDVIKNTKHHETPEKRPDFPELTDQYQRPALLDIRQAVQGVVSGDEPDLNDKELNRMTSLRLQQAFQHISSFKSRLITPADTSKPYEWREIHIPGPGHPGDFSSLSSRGTTTTTTNNNYTADSGVGTDDDTTYLPKVTSPSRRKSHTPPSYHQHQKQHQRFCPRLPSDLSVDSTQHSIASLPGVFIKHSSETFGFRPLSSRSSDSYPSETIDDQCTTTSGSYSINMDDQHGAKRPSLHMGDFGYIQDIYV